MNGDQPQIPQPKKTLWIVIVIVLLAVLAVIYYLYFYNAYNTPSGSVDSDDVSAIESDLEALPTEGLDSELNDIEKEL